MKKVDVAIDDGACNGPTKYSWTFGHLDARMENTSAFLLHQKKDRSRISGLSRRRAAVVWSTDPGSEGCDATIRRRSR